MRALAQSILRDAETEELLKDMAAPLIEAMVVVKKAAALSNRALGELEPHIEQWEKDGLVPRTFWEKAGANGFLCASMPEQYGGGGGDFGHEAALVLAQGEAGIGGLVGFAVMSAIGGAAVNFDR